MIVLSSLRLCCCHWYQLQLRRMEVEHHLGWIPPAGAGGSGEPPPHAAGSTWHPVAQQQQRQQGHLEQASAQTGRALRVIAGRVSRLGAGAGAGQGGLAAAGVAVQGVAGAGGSRVQHFTWLQWRRPLPCWPSARQQGSGVRLLLCCRLVVRPLGHTHPNAIGQEQSGAVSCLMLARLVQGVAGAGGAE